LNEILTRFKPPSQEGVETISVIAIGDMITPLIPKYENSIQLGAYTLGLNVDDYLGIAVQGEVEKVSFTRGVDFKTPRERKCYPTSEIQIIIGF